MAAYANWLLEGAQKYGLEIHAWVLMTNHVHLLVTPLSVNALSKFMQFLGRYYVRYFNHRFRRTGTLFEGRFKGHLVQSGRYFLQCCRYIELNPVRAGMVIDPVEYQWSSYAAHAFGQQVRMWTAHPEYFALGATAKMRQETYRNLFETALEKDMLDDIRAAVNTGFVLGNESFRQQVEALSGIPQTFLKRGRPRNVREM
jgi:putative transposase